MCKVFRHVASHPSGTTITFHFPRVGHRRISDAEAGAEVAVNRMTRRKAMRIPRRAASRDRHGQTLPREETFVVGLISCARMSADRSHRQARGARSRADELSAVLKSVFLTAGPKTAEFERALSRRATSASKRCSLRLRCCGQGSSWLDLKHANNSSAGPTGRSDIDRLTCSRASAQRLKQTSPKGVRTDQSGLQQSPNGAEIHSMVVRDSGQRGRST
jgi:hypothetical protein